MASLYDAPGQLDGRDVILALLACVFTYISVEAIANYRKLPQFKGPPLAAISRIWLFKHSLSADVNTAQFNALRKYGTSTVG